MVYLTFLSECPKFGVFSGSENPFAVKTSLTKPVLRLWEGPHIFGGTLVGVLYEDADWLRAELFTCKDCRNEIQGSLKR